MAELISDGVELLQVVVALNEGIFPIEGMRYHYGIIGSAFACPAGLLLRRRRCLDHLFAGFS